MQVSMKSTLKIIKPCSEVDKAFKAQGFTKKQKKNYPYFHLKIQDNSTLLCYDLQIPIYEYQKNEKSVCKIHEINIKSKDPVLKNQQIPQAVVTAAYEKIREVFSYLE